MDYCSSCRRHLNGALVCPGCGAYAPDIAPSTTPAAASGFVPAAPYDSNGSYGSYDFTPGPAAFPLTEMMAPAERPSPVAPDTWDAGGHDHGNDHGDGDGDVDLEAVPVATRGRAARRRQRARWKKTQRRAVVATAVALVGGGLTLASMDRHSGDRAQAAAGPKNPGAGQSAQDDVLPTSPRPDTQRSVPTAHTQSASDSGHTSAHYATASVRTAPGGQPGTGTATATQVHTATLSAPQSYTAASSSDGTASGHAGTPPTTPTGTTNTTNSAGTTSVTTPVQAPAPAPAPTSGTDSGTSPTTTTSSTSTTSDPATQPQHQQLCLLVLCVG
ncbi:hypothetical protein [Streptomyces sp. L2]|uniref:SCO2400 family protein n=1 Tax=Streptomyces sp. L2 TaxID=2162665 RepID=UPI0010133E39|nr:hypothetical protein [Streptomyces sp. L2]